MFIAVIVALSLILVLADIKFYNNYIGSCCRIVWVRYAVASLFVVVNLLPYIAVVVMQFGNTPKMVPMMWLLTIYTISSLSRLALYLGVFLLKNIYVKWIVGLSLCTIVAWVLLVGVVRTRKELTVRSVEISSTRLPKAFDGYRIVFFSDLHVGTLDSAEEMCCRLVDRINALNADLVLFGGDLVNISYDELTPKLQTILGDIKARDGVVAVLGNHDTGVYVRDSLELPIEQNTSLLMERMHKMGWRIADDETELLSRGGDTITLTGIGFSRELLEYRHSADVADSLNLKPLYEGVSREKFNITVSHMPQLWRKIAGLGYGDLVLSGHVHAMQMKGCIGGCEFSPAQLMYREWSGLYKENQSHLYITDGVGSVGFHMRIGAPPEISELILRRIE